MAAGFTLSHFHHKSLWHDLQNMVIYWASRVYNLWTKKGMSKADHKSTTLHISSVISSRIPNCEMPTDS